MRWPTSPSSVAENSIVWVPPGAVAQDPLDLRGEPVVGHAVGLVEHDDLRRRPSSTSSGLQEVDQPQRRGDDDLDARRRAPRPGRAGWRRRTPAARACRRGRRPARAPRRPGRPARGSERARGRAAAGGLGLVGDAGQHRHAEGERLAGAGAGPAAHVAALHRHRDGLGLDLERLGEARTRRARRRCAAARRASANRSAARPAAGSVVKAGESRGVHRWSATVGRGTRRPARSPPAAGGAPPLERLLSWWQPGYLGWRDLVDAAAFGVASRSVVVLCGSSDDVIRCAPTSSCLRRASVHTSAFARPPSPRPGVLHFSPLRSPPPSARPQEIPRCLPPTSPPSRCRSTSTARPSRRARRPHLARP